MSKTLVLEAAATATNGNVSALARLLCAPDRTVRAWLAEETKPSPTVQKLLRLLADPKTSPALAGLLNTEL